MSRGNRRTLLFKDASDHIRFLESIIRAKEIYPFRIHALCLMSNHFHMAVETVDVELWKIMQRILHAKYIHNILTRLIEYLVDENHSHSRGKMILPPHGKEFFTSYGKHFFGS